MGKARCHFINGADRVRFMERHIYNREQLLHFDFLSAMCARRWNSDQEWMENRQAQVDMFCRHNYQVFSPFRVGCRGKHRAERVPWGPALEMTLDPFKTSL